MVSFVIMTRHKKWQRYYIKPSESLIVRQSFHYSCLHLYWYRRRYFNPLHTHKHHEDDMQNTWTVILVSLFLELLSFEQWTKSFLPCTCVRTVSWKLFKIFSGNFTQMQNTMKWRAKHMNCNPRLPTFGVIALWTLKIIISTMYSCPLCKLRTIQDILMQPLTSVKHHDTTCRTQKKCNYG